nr:probable RNA methyltransferase CG11342 isoform X1 [Megalopta genalis]XP_033326589.1 probable RNA methyltransferase CG11342 isoform X2 [Megalopta genalis]XP_033326590.1 probable RNA methyltransferase CG11342 isoform X2 [Megalopta genalis]XP_033326591.1 probable RNA methyltransferase CG11342 isoform X2 [Megalopta genalis]XP_033326592.1 probable RNA methyltransferase CG11342 isoform X2 [Megalopta genalis]XP_033326594.1 probable RNA methyltransferase CG11342 isoform X1 [Megalopta genalis]XP_03
MEEESTTPTVKKREDPAASRHGNFSNYYDVRPVEDRLLQLPFDVWRPTQPGPKYVALDVGCNAGDLTFLLRRFLERFVEEREVFLLGVDLDMILIERAQERNPRPDRMTFNCLDFVEDSSNRVLGEYLRQTGKPRFDVVFCFSVTMWIHLNHGDKGLIKFLRKACSLTDMIVIEPQLWPGYEKACKRLKRSKGEDFPLFETLRLRGDPAAHIHSILSQLCNFRRIKVTAENTWNRKILIYERR